MPSLAGSHAFGQMDKSGYESTMNVLIWGVVLLGGIGIFIIWGLANAYPSIN